MIWHAGPAHPEHQAALKRVDELTELAQQLVNAAGAPWNQGWVQADPVSALAKWSYELREALDAAAELGITPKDPS